MKKILLSLGIAGFLFTSCTESSTDQAVPEKESSKSEFALAIHGGAGTIKKENMTPEQDAEYRAKLKESLDAGFAVLENGGSSLDAVIAAVKVMEDSPLFNAGKGAVFTNEGKNELDAAIMYGADRNAGAVAGITTVKNPITAARAVLENSPHVFMIGKGAEQFAAEQNLELVDPSYFFTQHRFEQLEKIKETEKTQLDHSALLELELEDPFFKDRKFGTVGAVALDKNGNIAAATSTGGMTNKRYGRVGDVPIIGAGTYADNETCAVSATGHGEFFIRTVVGHEIASIMRYGGKSLQEAADEVVMGQLVKIGGSGGIISIDKMGNIAMPFNSEGMYRGYRKAGEEAKTFIYKDDK
ncbi:isoaspartyl peptidase/L-asparaginase [Algoriphagus sp. CAU 1675]|uniref:isoaspartyl peptidase/L-asparaginase family protein n=1 Tax=Algoriphagus sp. CAU 1675 TaxID=3032597 RepID=UPI0023DA5A27|nr:isoaspartyl peptidase/L-asparaginase [Algoriphagus sp. CAU 1675]MDF2158805.1 isoaspartyl peptidase/L-asparaginase [Algoriphagus sp. CAU 1675]